MGNTPGVTILSRAKDTPGVKEYLHKSCYKLVIRYIYIYSKYTSYKNTIS